MDGHGTIVRLVEVGGKSTTARLTFPLFHLQQAWATNALEQNQSPVKVEENSLEVPVSPPQIITLRVIKSD